MENNKKNENSQLNQQVTVKVNGGYISGHCIHVNAWGSPSEIMYNGVVYKVDGTGFFAEKK